MSSAYRSHSPSSRGDRTDRGSPRYRQRSSSSSPNRGSGYSRRSPPPPPRRRSRSPPPRSSTSRYEKPEPSKKLGVFGLNYRTTRRDLEKEFGRFGPIEAVDVVKDHEGRSRGFAFVSFEHMADAADARSEMADILLDGRRIRVDFAFSRGPHPSRVPRRRSPDYDRYSPPRRSSYRSRSR